MNTRRLAALHDPLAAGRSLDDSRQILRMRKEGVFVLRTWELETTVDGFQSSAGSPLKGPSTRLSEPGPPVRPLKEKELGPLGELSTSTPGTEVPELVAPRLRQTCLHVERTMWTWETKWLREASVMPNLSGVTNFVNLDDGTARQTQRPGN